jgi:hypothetical protein
MGDKKSIVDEDPLKTIASVYQTKRHERTEEKHISA